jgi:hypothetical protein
MAGINAQALSESNQKQHADSAKIVKICEALNNTNLENQAEALSAYSSEALQKLCDDINNGYHLTFGVFPSNSDSTAQTAKQSVSSMLSRNPILEEDFGGAMRNANMFLTTDQKQAITSFSTAGTLKDSLNTLTNLADNFKDNASTLTKSSEHHFANTLASQATQIEESIRSYVNFMLEVEGSYDPEKIYSSNQTMFMALSPGFKTVTR